MWWSECAQQATASLLLSFYVLVKSCEDEHLRIFDSSTLSQLFYYYYKLEFWFANPDRLGWWYRLHQKRCQVACTVPVKSIKETWVVGELGEAWLMLCFDSCLLLFWSILISTCQRCSSLKWSCLPTCTAEPSIRATWIWIILNSSLNLFRIGVMRCKVEYLCICFVFACNFWLWFCFAC